MAPGTTAPVHRRISYVVPAPSEPRTKLVLPPLDTPRRGRTVPLVIPDTSSSFSPGNRSRSSTATANGSRAILSSRNVATTTAASSQPTHRLGVSAMAIDLSTHIAGKSSPEGILYSAGRDGLVIAWELGAPTKPRRRPVRQSPATRHRHRKGDWKAMTGWDDDQDLSDEESNGSDDGSVPDFDEEPTLDRIYASTPQRSTTPSRTPLDKSIPYEQRWQVDEDRSQDIEPVSHLPTK